ncbi:MAG: hypothetical protein SOT28_07755 [Fusicatenibacter sp.]|nr:hypothetical protein [Lachnospiraceae bacterium]MDY2938185.1 hypothetical protein [Fusicatenibacter sp.]
MTILIECKEKLKELYGSYSSFVLPVCKFLLAFVVFNEINRSMGFMKLLTSTYVVLILSLICAIIPMGGMAALAMLVIIGHCFALNLIVAGIAVLIMLIFWFLYLRFAPKEGTALILTPLAFWFHIPAAAPIGFGLVGTPMSALAVSCGVVIYSFIELIRDKISVMLGSGDVEMLTLVQELLNGLLRDEKMLVTIVACAAAVVIVNCIRRISADYAWQISVVSGAVIYALIMIAGRLVLDVEISLPGVLIQAAVSAVIGFILQFFLFGADYSRSEHLEFEDDEYYYYVKAIPKFSVSRADHRVKYIQDENEESALQTEKYHSGSSPEEYQEEVPPVDGENCEDVDYESMLEDTLKNL